MNNASLSGLSAIIAGQPIYTASKFAVVGLTRSVALEVAAKGVRVNAVCPAIIETEMTEGLRQNNELRVNFKNSWNFCLSKYTQVENLHRASSVPGVL